MLPFGGPKGSAISFIIDIFCGVLTGAAFASHLNTLEDLGAVQNVGHVFAAVRTDLFLPDAEFRSRMDAILAMLKSAAAGRRAASGCWCPARSSSRTNGDHREQGIALPPAIAAQLADLGAELGVAFPVAAGGAQARSRLPHDPRRRAEPSTSCRCRPIVHFGCGIAGSLPDHVRALGGRHVFVVTDPGVRAAGIVDRVLASLDRRRDSTFSIYDNVTADSGSTLIGEAVGALKASGADVVVGLGGGSALDTGKAVAALATNPGSPLDYVGLHKVKNRPLPMIAVPTTAGTGSEVSLWSVFTDDERKLKVAIGGVLLYPAVALCDPDLTLDLPAGADRVDRDWTRWRTRSSATRTTPVSQSPRRSRSRRSR